MINFIKSKSHFLGSGIFVIKYKDGYIETKDGVHTSTEGIYVAGDARAKELKQLVTATSDGAMAADAAIKEME